MSGYLPNKDNELAAFANNMESYLTADPAGFSVSIAQAAAFAVLASDFQSALTTLENPANRNPVNTQAKNDARVALINGTNGIRQLVDIIQASPTTTDIQRQQIQITIRDEPTPVPVPSSAPSVDVVSRFAKTIRIQLHDPADPTKRSKPEGVYGAQVMTFFGTEPPAQVSDYTLNGTFTRTTIDVVFPAATPPNTQAWIIALWMNTKGQLGPASTPLEVWTASGLSAAA